MDKKITLEESMKRVDPWQPLEAAPNDRTPDLVWMPGKNGLEGTITTAWQNKTGCWLDLVLYCDLENTEITAWMPMLPGPGLTNNK